MTIALKSILPVRFSYNCTSKCVTGLLVDLNGRIIPLELWTVSVPYRDVTDAMLNELASRIYQREIDEVLEFPGQQVTIFQASDWRWVMNSNNALQISPEGNVTVYKYAAAVANADPEAMSIKPRLKTLCRLADIELTDEQLTKLSKLLEENKKEILEDND